MKILKQLIKLHKFLFLIAILFTFLSIIFILCWNKFLAETLDIFGDVAFFDFENSSSRTFTFFITGIFIILLYTTSEYLSSYLASILVKFLHMKCEWDMLDIIYKVTFKYFQN